MLNTSIVMGKIVKTYVGEDGSNYFDLAIEREFREQDGSIKEDVVKCTLWKGIVDQIMSYYHPGQMLVVTGRLENRNGEVILVGEKANFTKSFSR